MEVSISMDPAIDDANLLEYLSFVNAVEDVSVHFDLAEKSACYLDYVKFASKHRVDVHTWGDEIDIDETVDSYNFSGKGSVVVMSVKCGASGQTFNPVALEKVKQVRAKYPNTRIIVDGGINDKNIALVRDAGADVAVVGNFLYVIYKSDGAKALCKAVARLSDTAHK